jgi:hypothetical protein
MLYDVLHLSAFRARVRTIGHFGLDVGDRLENESTRHSQAGCNSDSTASTVNAHLAISTVSCLMGIKQPPCVAGRS